MESPLEEFQPKDRAPELLEKLYFFVFPSLPRKQKVTLFPVCALRCGTNSPAIS